MSYYTGNTQYSWYSRVEDTQAGVCGVVSSGGQQCTNLAGSSGMCYSHEAEVRAEVTKASGVQSSYGSNGGYGYSCGAAYSGYAAYGYGYR